MTCQLAVNVGRHLSIDVAAMPDAVDANYSNRIRNLVDNSIVADTYASVIPGSGEFPAAGRARISSEALDGLNDSVMHVIGKPAQIFFCRAFEKNFIHALWASARRGIDQASGTASACGVPA